MDIFDPFLNKDNFFGTSDDKISAGIERTLFHFVKLGIRLIVENTTIRSQHNWHATNDLTLFSDALVLLDVDQVDLDRGRVGQVAKAALVRCYTLRVIRILDFRLANIN